MLSDQGRETPASTMMSSVWTRFSRRKQLEAPGEGTSKLDKCLNTFDLTALGIGATLGESVNDVLSANNQAKL